MRRCSAVLACLTTVLFTSIALAQDPPAAADVRRRLNSRQRRRPRQAEPATIAKHNRWVSSIAFLSNDALVSAGGQTLLYRPRRRHRLEPRRRLEKNKLQGHETTVWSVAVSPDGKLLATASYDGVVKIWDVAEGKLKHDLKKHKNLGPLGRLQPRQQAACLGQRGYDRRDLERR